MTAPLNALSLFAGIGGLELGLERAGMQTVGQVEIDRFCRRVLEKHWPGVPRHDDVRTAVDWWTSEQRPRVGVVCGGFPCQPFSPSGLRRGIGDDRWGWPWFADVLRAVRPSYVVVENVPGLLTWGGGEAFGVILGDLASLGFDAEWSIVSACSMGAPHMRKRLLIVAHSQSDDGELFGPAQAEPPRRVGFGERRGGQGRPGWLPEPTVGRVADGVPKRLVCDELHALGNAVVPQVAEYVGRLIVAHAEEQAA